MLVPVKCIHSVLQRQKKTIQYCKWEGTLQRSNFLSENFLHRILQSK